MKNKNAFIVVIVFILAIFLYARSYYKPMVIAPVSVQGTQNNTTEISQQYATDLANLELKPQDNSTNPYIYKSKIHNTSFTISPNSSMPENMVLFVIEDKDGIYIEGKNTLTGEVNLHGMNNYKKADSSIRFYPIKDPKNAKAEMIEKINTDTGNTHCTLFDKPGSLLDGRVVDDRMSNQQAYDFLTAGNDEGAIFVKYPQFKNLDICLNPKGSSFEVYYGYYFFPIQFNKDNTMAYIVFHPTQSADFYGDREHKIWWYNTIKVK